MDYSFIYFILILFHYIYIYIYVYSFSFFCFLHHLTLYYSEFSDEEDEPSLEEQKEVLNYSPLASPELSPRKLISSNHISNGQSSSNQLSSSPAKAMSPIDIHIPTPPLVELVFDDRIHKVKHLTTQSTSSRDSWSSGSDLDMPVQVCLSSIFPSHSPLNLIFHLFRSFTFLRRMQT